MWLETGTSMCFVCNCIINLLLSYHYPITAATTHGTGGHCVAYVHTCTTAQQHDPNKLQLAVDFPIFTVVTAAVAMQQLPRITPHQARALLSKDGSPLKGVPTSGWSAGYLQANLVVLPSTCAADFKRFCDLNSQVNNNIIINHNY